MNVLHSTSLERQHQFRLLSMIQAIAELYHFLTPYGRIEYIWFILRIVGWVHSCKEMLRRRLHRVCVNWHCVPIGW